MKKVITIAVILGSFLTAVSQPNGGFENWTNEFNYQVPDGWQTLNFISALVPPNSISSFKATGVDKRSGNFALKLKTIFINNNPLSGTVHDTIGYAFTGKVTVSPPSIKFGMPYSGRPEKLEFWAKYAPVGIDRAGASIALQKWNGTTTDTIAYGEIIIDSTTTYTFFQIDIVYRSAALPDTMMIGFTSSYGKSNARVGSTLYLDDVALTGWVGIEEKNIYSDKVKVFPNPGSDAININAKIDEADNIQVIDVSGKLVGNYKIQNYNAKINTTLFAEGVYIYEIRNKHNGPLTSGQFNVIK